MRATEHEHQKALIRWADLSAAAHPELRNLFAVPNGGHRHPATAAKLKAEGVRRGVPDLMLACARGGYAGLFLELKAEGGRVSPEQREWIDRLRAEGFRVEVCVGWDEARRVIAEYLGVDEKTTRPEGR